MDHLQASQLTVAYDNEYIFKELSLTIPMGKVSSIIGPNGCGKSTLLKTMSRLIKPQAGTVILNGQNIYSMKTKEVAQELAILNQTPQMPDGLTVYELVTYGRYPHRQRFKSLGSHDYEIIDRALTDTGMMEFKDRTLDALSGGQRQRAWIAMALAQETEMLFLDEPTTYLDMAHQLEILKLVKQLNEKTGCTIVMVLHDLNHAARFSDHLIAMKSGEIIYKGEPTEVICPLVLKTVFGIEALITNDPISGAPLCYSYDLCASPVTPAK